MANKFAKSFNMLPTFTEDLGPRQKRPDQANYGSIELNVDVDVAEMLLKLLQG
jgi:hypothetical protein